MLRQRHTGGLRVTRCASGPQGASWPGLACWIRDTDSAEVERLMKQGTQGFKDFWADYQEKYPYDGKEEYPQVTRDRTAPGYAPGYAGYFNSAADGNGLMRDVIKYGEMVQSVYDTLETKDINSQFFGNKWPDVMCPGESLSHYDDMGIITLKSDEGRQYKVVEIIKADSGAYKLIKMKEERNYVGFIAEGPPDDKGGVDIAVVFRGTITNGEWLQDIKALQVSWNHGRPVAASPRSQLDASVAPIDLSWEWFIWPWLLLQVGLAHWLAGLLGMQLQDTNLQHTISCVLAAGLIWLVRGGVVGLDKYPSNEEWKKDLKDWLTAIWQWAGWGIRNACMTVLDWEGTHISFGFKEMYADAQTPLKPTDLVPPRLTVMRTLADLLHKYQSPVDGQKLHIKSITVTGHSLGGALASLCAWDIGTTFNAACTGPTELNWWQRLLKASNSKVQELTTAPGEEVKSAVELYDLTDQHRDRVMKAVKQLQVSNAVLPAVAAVTFAAPMVGNATYAGTFKITGCKAQPVQTGMLRVVDAPDVVPTLPLTLPPTLPPKWPLMLALTLAPVLIFTWALTLPLTLPLTLALKLAFTPPPILAFVPALVLLAPPFAQLFWYKHGGQELQVDHDDVPYFLPFGKLEGVRARHNHEMYMHLLDPTRDIALANKTERVLIKGQKVPGSWWGRMPNSRMIEDGKWQKAKTTCEALNWYAAQAAHCDEKASQGKGNTDSKGSKGA